MEQDRQVLPRKIDKWAIEVNDGWVQVEGIELLIPLDEYLDRKEKHLQELKIQERHLYRECKHYIKQHLTQKSGNMQEDIRSLSWAYYANGDYRQLNLLKKKLPLMPLLHPLESDVQAHHLSHFIQAYLSVLNHLPPMKVGRSSNFVSRAEDPESALQAQILTWEYLISITPQDQPLPQSNNQVQTLPRQDNTGLDQLIQLIQGQQKQINQLAEKVEEILCKLNSKQASEVKKVKAAKSPTTTK